MRKKKNLWLGSSSAEREAVRQRPISQQSFSAAHTLFVALLSLSQLSSETVTYIPPALFVPIFIYLWF
jgi:hypothetical protein